MVSQQSASPGACGSGLLCVCTSTCLFPRSTAQSFLWMERLQGSTLVRSSFHVTNVEYVCVAGMSKRIPFMDI